MSTQIPLDQSESVLTLASAQFTVFEWGFVCVRIRKFVRNAELKKQHENCF